MKKKQIKTIEKFIGVKDYPNQIIDWNFTMMVVEKIESIIGHSIDINNNISISWWYSPKKTGTFSKGNGGFYGGETIKRKPFDSIFGEFHQIHCYYSEVKFKVLKNEIAKTKIEAVLLSCFRWIEWYNITVECEK